MDQTDNERTVVKDGLRGNQDEKDEPMDNQKSSAGSTWKCTFHQSPARSALSTYLGTLGNDWLVLKATHLSKGSNKREKRYVQTHRPPGRDDISP